MDISLLISNKKDNDIFSKIRKKIDRRLYAPPHHHLAKMPETVHKIIRVAYKPKSTTNMNSHFNWQLSPKSIFLSIQCLQKSICPAYHLSIHWLDKSIEGAAPSIDWCALYQSIVCTALLTSSADRQIACNNNDETNFLMTVQSLCQSFQRSSVHIKCLDKMNALQFDHYCIVAWCRET